ncbi:MAG: helix-turn-helix domain-containing protein, partial [Muribaculaceae bacterium]|nr:helix-turn-helix domain-containing protein [Muribaculaceae bacterium]
LHQQDKYNATFIIVADNKKYAPTSRRPLFNPLTTDSNPLISFADSAVGITRSTFDVRHRYIKHIKLRGGETAYDENYVIDCIITPPAEKTDSEDGNFLSLRPGHLLKESQYEQQLNLPAEQIEAQRQQIISQILELHNQGKSLRSIAAVVGLSKSTVHRHILDATVPDLAVPYLTFNPDSATLDKSDTADGTLFSSRYEHEIPLYAHYPGDPEYNFEINKVEDEVEEVIPENETDEQHIKRLEARAERQFLSRRTPYTVVNPPHCPQPDDTPPLRAIPSHAKTVTPIGTSDAIPNTASNIINAEKTVTPLGTSTGHCIVQS